MTTKPVKSIAVPVVETVDAAEETPAVQQNLIEPAGKGGSEIFKGYEDLLQFNQQNLEALFRSADIVARGVQDLSQSVVALAQGSFEDSLSAGKALAGAKTLKEVIDLSSSLAKSNFDKLVVESQKLGELSSKLAEEAIAPINKRVDAAVQSLTKIAA
ncbi:phasin family protein [Telmatospirillum siberiense]|nr:phasin family protein [Telmatospirillum siberiense]